MEGLSAWPKHILGNKETWKVKKTNQKIWTVLRYNNVRTKWIWKHLRRELEVSLKVVSEIKQQVTKRKDKGNMEYTDELQSEF